MKNTNTDSIKPLNALSEPDTQFGVFPLQLSKVDSSFAFFEITILLVYTLHRSRNAD